MANVQDNIIRTEYSEIMQKSYIDYAMSVIVARALPDVRDGLKPVQRRTLYDMYELGIRYDRPYRKCARIVGDTMGKYHPHGDSSIYESLVVMAQEFKKGQTLVDGHGNFGSIEGDGAAAMRYTEARLEKITQEVYLADLDKNVVDFVPNFDETEKEPAVLPVKVPNLLLNGADGIAVGMATSIPPHNLNEVIDGVIAYMKDNTIDPDHIIETEGVGKALHPPGKTCVPVMIPAVKRIAPELSVRGKTIRRAARYRCGHVVVVQLEEFGMGPGICAVIGNIDGNISDDPDSLPVCVGLQLLPLAGELELHIFIEFNIKIQFFPVIVQSKSISLSDILRPFVPALVFKEILHCHEEGIILQPPGIFGAKS